MRTTGRGQRVVVILQILLIIALILGIGYLFMKSDRKGPDIVFPENEKVLSGSMTEAQLIEGIQASDQVDGDVSETLRIESATKVASDRALLVYAAKDKSNNVSAMTRTVMIDETFRYEGMIEIASGDTGKDEDAGGSVSSDETLPADTESVPTETKSTSSTVESTTGSTTESTTESTVESITESISEESHEESDVTGSVTDESLESTVYAYDSEISTEDTFSADQFINTRRDPSSFTEDDVASLNENLRNANNIAISRLPDGYPVIRLNTYAVRKGAADSIPILKYISDIRDDADSVSDIFSRITVTGDNELKEPGFHTVNYYVTDSEGNRSNVAHLVVIVTE